MLSSSEEDEDQDEEELLQKALAEQAQRDVRYHAPPPASGPPARKAPIAPPQRGAPPPPADDDESEEELLSISSDDDGATPAPVKKSAAHKEANLGIDDFSDEEQFEDEPKAWAKVDEEELARTVREMREARSVPGGRAKLAAVTRKFTMVRDPLSREDLIDPLGLGTIDLKSFSLNRDAPSPTALAGKKGQDLSAVRDPAAREKVIYHSENFDAKFFLCHIHQNTKAADLEDGEAALKVDLQNRKQQLKLLVKENFDCFVSCKTTIDDIHSKLQQIETDPEGTGTAQLETAIQDVDKVARRAFGPLLERQAQAERIRSVQGMLQRFRTLFNLPNAISTSISKGEYDMAVREYKKTKSLVLPSHGKILKRVFEEVDKVVQELKQKLSRRMEDSNAEFSQLENAIRLLLELEPDSDPIWQYLNIQERRIRGMLNACVLEYEGQMEALQGRAQEKAESDLRWKQLQSESRRASEVDIFLALADEEQEAAEGRFQQALAEESDALTGRLIRRLTTVLVRYVPEFWRLAVSIFNGKFAKVSQQGSQVDDDADSYPFEEKQERNLKYTSHSVNEVVAMVQGIVSSYGGKVRAAFMPLSETAVMSNHMRDAVGEVARACTSLTGSNDAPPFAGQELASLQMDLMEIFIDRFCSLMREKASQLVNEEDWIPVPSMERKGSSFAISALPLKLQDLICSTVDHMKEVLEKAEECGGPDDLESRVTSMRDFVMKAFFGTFLDVSDLLEKLCSRISESSQTSDGSAADERFVGLQMGVQVVNLHQKLLMVASNVGYMRAELIGELVRKYTPLWTHDKTKDKKADSAGFISQEAQVMEAFCSLEEKIRNQYNYLKAISIGTAAAAYILDESSHLSATPPVKGIRDAAVELLHPLVAVHAEAFAGARPWARKIISVLFEGLMDALLNTSESLKHVDVNGYCQLMLELDYLEAVLKLYATSATRASLSSLRDVLLEKLVDVSTETENGGHQGRRAARGEEDESSVVPDDLEARAQRLKAQYLTSELQRTRMNIICFLENPSSIPAAEPVKKASSPVLLMSPSAGVLQVHNRGVVDSPTGRHRRRASGSSFSDMDKSSLPPPSPYHPASSADSSIGSRATRQAARRSLDDDLR